jgi:hypothetical protein
MALSRDSRFLYVRKGNGTVGGFRVQADGSLTRATSATGVPSGAQGIAADDRDRKWSRRGRAQVRSSCTLASFSRVGFTTTIVGWFRPRK